MKRLIREVPVALFLIFVCFFFFAKTSKLESAPSTNVKDVLSTSQLSYFALLGAGSSAGDNVIKVSVAGGNPSNDTSNLFVGDTIAIGTSQSTPLTIYTVRDIGNTAAIQLNSGIGATNNFVGAAIIATRSAVHTVHFTPKSTSPGNKWQFLIKATSVAGKEMDGIPDQDGFDLGQDVGSTQTGLGTRVNLADITCPFGVAASATGTTAVVTTGSTTGSYHIIECALSAGVTNPIDVGVSIVVGGDLASSSQLINPTASTSHTPGQADSAGDTYFYYIRHTDSSGVVYDADTTAGRIALVEAVRVTATVDPTLTFAIGTSGAVSAGATICGSALSASAPNTTATAVNFGSLNLGVFNNLAQHLSCITNADNGYVVTVFEQGVMKNINTATTIPDTNCNGGCSMTTAAAWTAVDTTQSEWGYSLEMINVGTSVFDYNTGYKAFGVGSSSAQTILSSASTPATSETAWVCYRLSVTNTQEAGNYEAKLVYTATATF